MELNLWKRRFNSLFVKLDVFDRDASSGGGLTKFCFRKKGNMIIRYVLIFPNTSGAMGNDVPRPTAKLIKNLEHFRELTSSKLKDIREASEFWKERRTSLVGRTDFDEVGC